MVLRRLTFSKKTMENTFLCKIFLIFSKKTMENTFLCKIFLFLQGKRGYGNSAPPPPRSATDFTNYTYLTCIQSNLTEIRLLCLIMAFTVIGKNYRRILLHAINYGFIDNCNLPVVGSNANYFPTKFCKVGQVSHL